MSVASSVSAFAFRGARGRAAVERLTYAAGIALLLLLFAAWIVSVERDVPPYVKDDTPWSVLGLADVFAVWLLGFGAFVLGPAVVAATVAGERRAGTLDQLRTTPMQPIELVAGLVVGAPARLYLLCAGPLAIHLAAGLTGLVSLDTMMETLVVLALGGLASAVIALCVALAPKQETGGAFVALGVAALFGASGLIASTMATEEGSVRWAFLHPAGALQAAMLQHDGLWRRLFVSSWRLERFGDGGYTSWLAAAPALSVAVTLVGGAVLLRAACRRLAAPHRPLFSKHQALALFALGAAGVILPVEKPSTSIYSHETMIITFASGLILLPLAATLAGLCTPTFESWALALRRGTRPRWWHDDAAPHRMFAGMVLLFLVAVRLRAPGFPLQLSHDEKWAVLWALELALTLPLFTLFGSTRYSTGPSRFAFGAAGFAHALYQVIIIAMFASNGIPSHSSGAVAVEAGMLMAVGVPAWIAWRQRRLAERVRAGAAA
jgi:ABC-2 family transporter protein